MQTSVRLSRGGGSKINWPFRLKACRRPREGEREGRGREKRKKAEGRGDESGEEKQRKMGAERVCADTTSVYVFMMEGGQQAQGEISCLC